MQPTTVPDNNINATPYTPISRLRTYPPLHSLRYHVARVSNALINKYPRAAAEKGETLSTTTHTPSPSPLRVTSHIRPFYYATLSEGGEWTHNPLLIFTRVIRYRAHYIHYDGVILLCTTVYPVCTYIVYTLNCSCSECVVYRRRRRRRLFKSCWIMTVYGLSACCGRGGGGVIVCVCVYIIYIYVRVCVTGVKFIYRKTTTAAADGRQCRHRKCVVSYVTCMYSSCHTHTRGTRRVYLDIFNPPPL